MFNPKEHMMNLKGKDYLQVMWRLVWFREEHPDWDISTDLVSVDESSAIFHCRISDSNGKAVSSGYGSESKKDFGDFIEKAETKAVGRALAMLGYGTQFAPELEEGERIVDSPVAKPAPMMTCECCGNVIRPYTGKDGKQIGIRQHSEGSKAKFNGHLYCIDCIQSGRVSKA